MAGHANEPYGRGLSERKKAEQIAKDAHEYAESIIATVWEPLVVLDAGLRVISASRSFYRAFKVSREETEGQFIYDLGNRQWDIPKLRKLLERILPKNASFDNYEIEHEFPSIGRRVMLLNARRIPQPPEKPRLILLAIEDITELKGAEQDQMRKKLDELERFQKVAVGRELRMVELKAKIRELEAKIRELEAKQK